ncbi:DUF1934 domain-containing protein [Niallia sp.]|uniref:DUF1934 domain-containing protein n=1 Tax=Niallia sp. TaxID=2837523 RepID=UPI002898DDCA|nr:DUF1934 domain-containing protein [Niallia sp.]
MSQPSAQQVPVKLHVTTHIYNGKNKESIEWIGFGQYLEKDTSKYIKYEEIIEEGTIKTIIKITEKEGLILRSGAVKMRLPFLINKQKIGSYESPYGVFQLVTDTKRLALEVEQQATTGSLDILYDLKMQGSNNGTYHMTISFKEETE